MLDGAWDHYASFEQMYETAGRSVSQLVDEAMEEPETHLNTSGMAVHYKGLLRDLVILKQQTFFVQQPWRNVERLLPRQGA